MFEDVAAGGTFQVNGNAFVVEGAVDSKVSFMPSPWEL